MVYFVTCHVQRLILSSSVIKSDISVAIYSSSF